MIEPVASYRLQLTPDLGFREAIGLLDHLEALGVSHLYASPITEAVPGSRHGYDVVDHTTVRADFGGAAALAELLDALATRGMALLVDHVPNHASTARPELNAPWWEMLRDGESAPGARWFDVDRRVDDRVLLPILGEPLADLVTADRIVIDGDVVVVDGGVRLPLAPGTGPATSDDSLVAALDRQHYRLIEWRAPERNVRRFFTIDDLVAVCVEVPEVAELVDTVPADLAAHPAFGGLRIDHLDGLAAPEDYVAQLRGRIGEAAWLVIEKILAPGETLPDQWPVDGTTGYEFARLVDHLLIDPAAEAALDHAWVDATGDARPFADVEDEARREVLAGGLRPDLDRTVAAAARALGELDHLHDAVVELTVGLPRYRTYLPDDALGREVLEAVASRAIDEAPNARATIECIVSALVDPTTDVEVELRTRWQQLTGPAMAKGAEDRAFYRYLRLASLCEVGGDPGGFGIDVDEFHGHNVEIQRRWPRTMVSASTHDTKRSADVRLRSAELTRFADDWVARLEQWIDVLAATVPAVPGATASLAFQTVVTCPGLDAERLTDFLVKAEREADLRTSWTDPDDEFETSLGEIAAAVIPGSALGDEVAAWAERLDAGARRLALVASAIRMLAPGVPDIFQGTEVASFRLVDPDNRIDPDWGDLRRRAAEASRHDVTSIDRVDPDAAHTVVIQRTLALRRRHLDAFGPDGAYEPLDVVGPDASRIVAFGRGGQDGIEVVVVAVVRGGGEVAPGTRLSLPPGQWSDVLVDSPHESSGTLALEDALTDRPVIVLERLPTP